MYCLRGVLRLAVCHYLRINLTISRDNKKREGMIILKGVALSFSLLSSPFTRHLLGSGARMVLGDSNWDHVNYQVGVCPLLDCRGQVKHYFCVFGAGIRSAHYRNMMYLMKIRSSGGQWCQMRKHMNCCLIKCWLVNQTCQNTGFPRGKHNKKESLKKMLGATEYPESPHFCFTGHPEGAKPHQP